MKDKYQRTFYMYLFNLPYRDEVTDPSHFAEIRDLPEAGDEELA